MPNGYTEHEKDVTRVREAIAELRSKIDERFYNHESQLKRLREDLALLTIDVHKLQIKIATWSILAGAISSGFVLLVGKFILKLGGI
jgi:hypothetical protein